MAKPTEQKKVEPKADNVISYSKKYGLDVDRKKLSMVNDDKATPKTGNPGDNFTITKIVMGVSKKKYNGVDPVTDALVVGKKPVAQFDVVHEDGSRGKYYAMNSAVVESCKNILEDEDVEADKDGNLKNPILISAVIQGVGENKRAYLAFQ